MKRRFLVLALVVVLMMSNLVMPISAAEVVKQGTHGVLTWTLDSEGKLVISGQGGMSGMMCDWFPGHEVKSIVIEEGVTSLAMLAFCYCSKVEDITIPSTVKEISIYALPYENKLNGIWVSEDNPYFTSTEDGILFSKDMTKLIRVPNSISGVYEIPETVTEIAGHAFYYAKNITEIMIPDTVEQIGESAFGYCTALTKIALPKRLTGLSETAFEGCTNLISVTLPDGLKEIGKSAFLGCEKLKEMEIPKTVTAIGATAFFGCKELNTICLPDTLTEIGDWTFGYSYFDIIEVPASVKHVGEYAFNVCSTDKVIFGGDAPAFADSAFSGTTTAAYYPEDNDTWTTDVMQDYEGTVTWVPYEQEEKEEKIETTAMYRLFNPNTGEHFYTGSLEEKDMLVSVGWHYEGIGWYAPIHSGDPIYRTFNPNSGDHHYTMSWEEVENLVAVGWNYEGVAWNGAPNDQEPQFRLYNPNADLGSHHYTSSLEERDFLTSIGWILEGIGWFGYTS